MTERATYLTSLRDALGSALATNEKVMVLGEDLLDPYGGAFKVTQGLSTKYPGRILNTPICESSIVGVATGLAIRGYSPVAEIMFGDFLALAADQILNSATKFGLMYKQTVTVPLVIRTPMGGMRGYGPTHSQSIEKMFFGMPGIKVVSPSLIHDPGALLLHSILNESMPVLFIEYKHLYGKPLVPSGKGLRTYAYQESSTYPVMIADNFETGNPDVVLLGYGGMSSEILSLMQELEGDEIWIRAVFPSLINEQLERSLIDQYILPGEQIIIAEMGTERFNWGSEMASEIYEVGKERIKKPIIRLASNDDVVPSGKELEDKVVLGVAHIRQSILGAL